MNVRFLENVLKVQKCWTNEDEKCGFFYVLHFWKILTFLEDSYIFETTAKKSYIFEKQQDLLTV